MTTQTTTPVRRLGTAPAVVRSIDEVGCNYARTEINYIAIIDIADRFLTIGVTPKITHEGAIAFDWEIGDIDDRRVFDDLATEHGHPNAAAEFDAALAVHATIDAYPDGGGDSLGAGNTVADATGVVHEHGCDAGDPDIGCICDSLTFVASLARVTA
jgi:hypothetical protein